MLKISIIVPVYNEECNMENLNKNLKDINPHEIIIVDGGSTDKTKELVDPSFTLISSPKSGRAFQMNLGAEISTGDILLFLHGDSIILPKDAITQITSAIENKSSIGCFRLKFDSKSLLMKICGFFSNLRVLFRNIAFGDQGIFIKHELFYKIGGYAEIPLMEDYKLSMDLKKRGYKFTLLNGSIVTSERRFLYNGKLKTMWKMQKLQYMFRSGADINLIAKLYREN